MKTIRNIGAILLTVLMLVSLAACGSDQSGNSASSENQGNGDTVYNLTLSHSDPSTSPVGTALDAWAAEMKEASGGRLLITVYPSATLAQPTDELSMVENGSIDMCWQVPAMNKGRFPVMDIVNTPTFGYYNSLQIMEACQNLFASNEAVKAEFDALGVKIVAMHGTGTNTLASRSTKFEQAADFQGFLIRANNAASSNIVTALGASPMACSVGELYENLSKNVINGNLSDASNLIATKSYEQLKYIMNYSFGSNVAFVVMNQAKYDALPEDLQKLIDDSFKTLSMSLSENFNNYMSEFFNTTAVAEGIEIYEPSEEVLAAISDANQSQNVEPWLEALSAAGLDAQAVYDDFNEAFSNAYTTYGEEYNWIQQ